jgi:exodeoxyribonuclease-5
VYTASSMPLSPQQRDVVQTILTWLARKDRQTLTLGGYAGTGKTTVLAALRYVLAQKRPEWKVAFAAYTGKATQVLAQKLKKIPLDLTGDNISTLHSLLYSPLTDSAGQVAGWRRKDELPYQLVVVDEASMMTEEIWRDLLRMGVPILAVGDHGQLPPIGESFNLMKEPDLILTEIHRQAEESPIIHLATMARESGRIPIGNYGQGVKKIDMTDSDSGVLLDELAQQYQPDMLFLVGQNRSRMGLNQTIRTAQARQGAEPEAGDMVICLRNQWQKGIFNGMIGKLTSIAPIRPTDGEEVVSYQAEIEGVDGKPLYSGLIAAAQFNAEATLDWSKKERDLKGELFDFGYALTVHKAQGSQARKVIVVEQRNQHMSDDDWKRWLYTAVTRAEEELVIFGTE